MGMDHLKKFGLLPARLYDFIIHTTRLPQKPQISNSLHIFTW